MKVVHSERNLIIAIDGVWVYVNERKWGFISNGAIYCHRRKVECFRREFGFHIPAPFMAKKLFFEVTDAGHTNTWFYDYTKQHRMLPTMPLIFVSLCRLTKIEKPTHVPRPSKPRAALPRKPANPAGC